MNLRDYQDRAKVTINNNIDQPSLLESCTLGMSGEVGKLSCIVNTDRFKGFDCIEERRGEIADILGDMLWFLSAAATALEIPLEDIAAENIIKIGRAYPK